MDKGRPKGKHPLIIMGPPRSGTTLLTRIINLCGLFTGYRVNNKLEDTYFIRFNEWWFHNAGRQWDKPMRGHSSFPLQQVVTKLSGSEYWDMDIPWAFKDPGRNDVLAPCWADIYPNARFIRIIRHPMDVALSLHKREKEKPEEWLNVPKPKITLDGDLRAYPAKSKRCLNLEGALELAEEYIRHDPGVDHEVIRFEDLVMDTEEILPEIEEIIDFGISAEKKMYIDGMMQEDRVLAYQQDHEEFWEENGTVDYWNLYQ